MSDVFSNPLYQPARSSGGDNPLYSGPSHKYPSQLIVQFLEGEGDQTIINGTNALNKLGNDKGIASSIVTINKSSNPFRKFSKSDVAGLGPALGRLSRQSRLYIRGHGDYAAQKIGAWGANEVADLLAGHGLPAVSLISVTGCELGRDRGTANDNRIGGSMNSFASHFHLRLKEKHGIRTVVYARVHCVAVGNSSKGAGVDDPSVRGHKTTFDDDDEMPGGFAGGAHRVHSKLKFWWDLNVQRREWA